MFEFNKIVAEKTHKFIIMLNKIIVGGLILGKIRHLFFDEFKIIV
jgi:hypothetical protein